MKKTRTGFNWILVFFLLLGSCAVKDRQNPVQIVWSEKKASQFFIADRLLKGVPRDSISDLLRIYVQHSPDPVLGDYDWVNHGLKFRPVIPFTRGLTYEIRLRGIPVSLILIPGDSASASPAVLAVYPSIDTIPLNLLKIHIEFSRPMQEGKASENILVLRNEKDTIPSPFLALEQELWNREGTILTLWLDPGRIKRDLQPNQKLGNPLQANNSYKIIINNEWRDREGKELSAPYFKSYHVGPRDSLSPDLQSWVVEETKAGTRNSLRINFQEPLDYILLNNAVQLRSEDGQPVDGEFKPGDHERFLLFIPARNWLPGEYALEVEPRLEDLAGNNLERLFDRDLTQGDTRKPLNRFRRTFRIR